jgi:uncharacterized membrane protein YczE
MSLPVECTSPEIQHVLGTKLAYALTGLPAFFYHHRQGKVTMTMATWFHCHFSEFPVRKLDGSLEDFCNHVGSSTLNSISAGTRITINLSTVQAISILICGFLIEDNEISVSSFPNLFEILDELIFCDSSFADFVHC